MSQILVRFGTRGILGTMRAKKKPRKSMAYKALTNEAEGTRALSLRIDSMFPALLKTSILNEKRIICSTSDIDQVHTGYPGIPTGTGSIPQSYPELWIYQTTNLLTPSPLFMFSNMRQNLKKPVRLTFSQ